MCVRVCAPLLNVCVCAINVCVWERERATPEDRWPSTRTERERERERDRERDLLGTMDRATRDT